MSTYPTIAELLARKTSDRPGETLLEVRMTYLSVLTYIFWSINLSILIGVLIVVLPNARIAGLSPWWLMVIPAGIVLEILRRRFDDLYVIADDKVTHISGRLSLQYKRPMMNYEHIVLIIIRQDLMGRIFGYGDVELSSAAAETNELTISGIRNPRGLALLLEDFKALAQRKRSGKK